MKTTNYKIIRWWNKSKNKHIHPSGIIFLFIFGIFITTLVITRLINNQYLTKTHHDVAIKTLVEPIARDGLSDQEAKKVAELISETINIPVTVQLEGIKLNHVYGRMGKEQHLPRYPGDKLEIGSWFLQEGMTPGVGAFGYFVNSRKELTIDHIQMEKYYIAVQTLYLSNWNTNWQELKPWFAFRNMLVLNPHNGKMVLAVVGDAGPADWTGKQFGGSPEIYHELGLTTGKDNVIVLFIDTNNYENKIKLGPLVY